MDCCITRMLDVTFEKETYVDKTTFLCVSSITRLLFSSTVIMTPEESFSGWFLFATNTTIDLDMFVEILWCLMNTEM
jgi:hypothetical protein